MLLAKYIILGIFLLTSAGIAQQGVRAELGKLQTGAIFSFVRNMDGDWGIEISGGSVPRLMQQKPAKIEVFKNKNDIQMLTVGYKTIEQKNTAMYASAEIVLGEDVVFHIRDAWSLIGAVVSVNRKVEVSGDSPGGFNSSVELMIDPSVNWDDVKCMAPGSRNKFAIHFY